MRTLTRGPYGVHYKGSWLKVTLGPLQLGTPHPRPQGFSLGLGEGKSPGDEVGHPSGKIGGPRRRWPWERGWMGALEYKSFTFSLVTAKRECISPCVRKFRSLYGCKKFWMWYHRTCSHPPTSCKCHAFTARNRVPTQRNQPWPGQEPISSWPGWVRDISPWLASRTLIWSYFPVQKWAIQSSFIRLELFMALYYQLWSRPKVVSISATISRLIFIPLHNRLLQDIAILMYKVKNNMCPTYISPLS